jgi:hypothetical protein
MRWVLREPVLSSLSSLLPIPTFDPELTRSFPQAGITPETNGGVGPENPETSRDNTIPIEKANHANTSPRIVTLSEPEQQRPFLSGHKPECATHNVACRAPSANSFSPVFRHSDPCSMSALARAECVIR